MKRIYFILLSLLLIGSTAFAQNILLFEETFETVEDFARWTNEVTPPNGGNPWVHTPGTANAGHGDMTNIDILTHADVDDDAWIFSPGITLKAGVTYDLTFWVRLFSVMPRPRLAVGFATAANRNNVTGIIYDSSTDFKNPATGTDYDYGTTWREQKVSYIPESDGIYYLGFHGITPKKDGLTLPQDHIIVDDIKLEGPVSNNLTLTRGFPYNYKQVPVSQNALVAAKIQNTGLLAQTNVTFSATINGGAPITTAPVASLAPGATSDFSITSGVTFAKGANTVDYEANQNETDEFPDDSKAVHEFTGTDIIYATETATNFTVGDIYVSKTFGNIYKIVNSTVLTGVEGGFGEYATYPLALTIALYRLNGDLTIDPAPIFTKEVTGNASVGLYSFPLDAPVTLAPGDYFLAIEGGMDGIVRINGIRNYYEKTGDALTLASTGTVVLRMVMQAENCDITPVPETPVPGTNSVVLAWESADAYQYKVTLTYAGEDHVYTTYNKSITINNLPSGTDFTWTVAALCDAIQSGTPVAGANFSTQSCPEFVSESFESETFPASSCWTNTSNDPSHTWKRVGSGSDPECLPQDGNSLIEFAWSSGKKGVLITPAFTHTGHLKFSFWMYRESSYSSYKDSLNIYLSNNQSIIGLKPLKTVYRAKSLAPVENGADGWYPYEVILPGEAGTIVYVAIEAASMGGSNIYIDNIAIGDYTDVADAGVTAITAPVSGINLTNAETVTVTVKNFGTTELTNVPVKFEVNDGIPVTETVPGPIAVNGGEVSYTFETKADLSTTATIDFAIKAYTELADDADSSNDAATATVKNAICELITTPWNESFESGTFPPSLCWTNTSNDPSYTWKQVETGSVPACSPQDGSALIEFPWNNGKKGVLITPAFTHTGHLKFSFWMYRENGYPSNKESLNIYLSNTQDITGLTPLRTLYRAKSLAPVENGADGWYPYEIILPGEAGTTAYVALEAVAMNGNNIHIDNIAIGDYVDATDVGITAITAPVSGLDLTNAETVTVTVKNFGTTELTNVPVKFEVNGGTPVTGIVPGPIVINGGEVSYTFDTKADLSATATTYFTIKAYTELADDADSSNDATTVTITNAICSSAISTLPWYESFEETVFPSFCWTSISSNNSPWKRVTSGGVPDCSPHEGAAMLQYNNYSYSAGKTGVLFTPAFSLGNNFAEFSFWMYRDNNGSYTTDKDIVNIYLTSTPTLTNATLLTTIHRHKNYAPVESGADGWYQYKVTIPAGLGEFYIGIEGVSQWGNNTYLDDIKLINSNISVATKSTTPVAIDAPVTVTFDKEIDTNGAPDLSLITLKLVEDESGDNLADEITVSDDKKTISIAHDDFEYGVSYKVAIPGDAIKGLVNISGNPGYSFTFDTELAALTAPVYAPSDNATDVALDADVTITFNRAPTFNMTPTRIPVRVSNVITVKGTETIVPSNTVVALDNNVITIDHDDFAYNTEYTVTIPAGSLLNPDDYNEALTWSFKTALAEISKVSTTPADYAQNIAPDAVVSITFDKEIDLNGAPDFSLITLQQDGVDGGLSANLITAEDIQLSDDKKTLTIDHESFVYGAPYIVKIPKAAITGLNTCIFDKVEVNFTIVDAPLEITAYNPAENATDVALNAPVSVTFNRNPHIIDTGGGGFPPIFFSATDDEPAVVTIKVKETGEPVADVVASVALFSNILAIDHASFAYGTEYEVNVPAGVVIEADDYADAITWSFTTIAVLEVTERVPADNSTVDLDGIDFEGSIQAKFNRAITLGDTATIKATVNAVPYSVTRQNQNKDLKINVPEGYFMPSTTYTVVIPAGIITEIDTDITWTFTTAPAVAVVAQTPAPRAEGVALNAEVSVEFSKNVRIPMAGVVPTATITAGDITVGNVTYDVDESGRKFVLAHDDFEFLTTYTVTIPDGMLTTYHEAITWSFTTVDDVAIKKVSDKPSVYPTLSKGKVTVNSAPESIVSVTDVYGKTLAIYQSTGELKLDLNYANGVYLIVINDGKIATHKVILQR